MSSRPSKVVTALAVVLVCTAAAGKNPPPRGAAGITAAQLRDYLTFIASDDLEGRDTPSRGLDITAKFLATQLARWGVEPGGDDGTFLQRIRLTTKRVDPEHTTAKVKDRTFVYGRDFLAGATAGTVQGNLVYVGHGYIVKAKNLDAYRGTDVAGKILVAHLGYPQGVSRNDTRGPSGENWESPTTYAAKHGAKGVVFIPTFETLARWEGSRQRSSQEGTTTMDSATPTRPPEPTVPSITASAAMIQAIFADEKIAPRDIFRRAQENDPADAFALTPAKQVTFTVETKAEPAATQNVVGIIRGSDPVLKNEFVALGAHYDHVGTGTEGTDLIFNGADDDGSGTTALLAIAETVAHLEPRPKRSLLFVWHAGEEHGLWGSAYYTQHPTVPLDTVIAQLNIDMIGRSRQPGDDKPANKALTGPDEVYVIGSKMMSSALGELSEKINDGYLKLSFNYKYDDPMDPNRFFFRSDHYNYAKKGVPIIFYFSGVHEDYHQPSDSVDKIDFAKMEKVTRTVYATALALLDGAQRPTVDKSLPRQLTEP